MGESVELERIASVIEHDAETTKRIIHNIIVFLQFIFCADVAASIVLYRKLKKAS